MCSAWEFVGTDGMPVLSHPANGRVWEGLY